MKLHPSFSRRGVAAFAAAGLACSAAVIVSAAPASATISACNSSTRNWAADYPTLSGWNLGSGATACFGNKGSNYPAYNSTQVFCAGNNSGTVTYIVLATGAEATHSFWPDGSYGVVNGVYEQYPFSGVPQQIDVVEVTINGWSGSAGC